MATGFSTKLSKKKEAENFFDCWVAPMINILTEDYRRMYRGKLDSQKIAPRDEAQGKDNEVLNNDKPETTR